MGQAPFQTGGIEQIKQTIFPTREAYVLVREIDIQKAGKLCSILESDMGFKKILSKIRGIRKAKAENSTILMEVFRVGFKEMLMFK